MATDTTTPDRTIGRQWDKLEPAMMEPEPATKHVRLPASISYAMGQIVGPVTATPGVYAAPGTGVTGPYLPLMYPWTTDSNGYATLGGAALVGDPKHESVEVYYAGAFKLADLVGVADDTILGLVGRLVQGTGRTDPAAIVVLG